MHLRDSAAELAYALMVLLASQGVPVVNEVLYDTSAPVTHEVQPMQRLHKPSAGQLLDLL
jgi:hypothetical protein